MDPAKTNCKFVDLIKLLGAVGLKRLLETCECLSYCNFNTKKVQNFFVEFQKDQNESFIILALLR